MVPIDEDQSMSEQSAEDQNAASEDALCGISVSLVSSQRFSRRVKEQLEACNELEPSNVILDCEFCSLTLKTSMDFVSHLRVHKLEALFTCPFCNRIFGSYPRYVEHMKNHFFDMSSKGFEFLLSSKNKKSKTNNAEPTSERLKSNQITNVLLEKTNINSDSKLTVISNSSAYELPQTFENGLNNSGRTELQLKPVKFYPWSQKKFNYNLQNTEKFNCSDCNFSYMTLENYDRHLSDFHCLASSFLCPFCPREHTSLRYLQKHVRKMHAVAESPSVIDELPLSIEEAEIAQDLGNIDKQPDVFAKLDSLQNGFCGREVLLKSLCQTSSTWTQCLSFSSIACSALEEVMSSVGLALDEVQKDTPSVSESAIFAKLHSCTRNFKTTDVSNQYQLISFLKKQEKFVEPLDLKFGEENELRSVGGKSQFKETIRTGQFIPISGVLSKIIFQEEDVFQVCLAYENFLKKLSCQRVLFDINQSKGSLNLDAKSVIREVSSIVECDEGISVQVTLQLYFDELETANPIGSRATIHKIGCFYWCLKSLPPWLNSDMRYTFVVALVSYLDVKSLVFLPL